MNEGDSAGGGHQGLSPAPPAVLDRRSTTISSNIQIIYSQENRNQNQTQILTSSGSAVSSSINALQHQQQQQHHMSTRYLSSNDLANLSTQQQQRFVIAQIQQQQQQHQQQQQQQQQQQSILIHSNNSNSGIYSRANNIVSSSYLNIGRHLTRATNVSNYLNTNSNNSPQSVSVPSLPLSDILQQQQQQNIQSTANISENSDTLNTNYRKCFKCYSTTNQSSSTNSSSTAPQSNTSANNNSNNTVSSGVTDISAIKKRILEHKYLRLRNLKEKYSEHVGEMYFLQTGGTMMDYPVWKKKPPSSHYINFTKSNRLDRLVVNENNRPNVNPSNPSSSNTSSLGGSSTNANLPQGAEIKIPGVGATPVAVSTTLPAAVVQLTQQGGTPLVPDIPSSLSNISDKRSSNVTNATNTSMQSNHHHASTLTETTTIASAAAAQQQQQQQQQHATIASGTGTQTTTNNNPLNGVQEQFSVKAKQEVYVMQRISELQREGLWTEKRLPKLQEPSRHKAHWDYLLEEMTWLAADFAQERKWKKAAAKKCSRMIQKYFNDKANAAQKAEKAQELRLKKIAGFIAKEIKGFWASVEKFVDYKHQTKLDEKRKQALDLQLSYIVDQTEKFSQQLAEGMNKTTSVTPSRNSSNITTPKESDDEFQPESEISDDDEETIAKAEAEAADVKEEIAALQKESQMDLDDFIEELPKGYLENRDKIVLNEEEFDSDSESVDREFEADEEESSDDENTIMEQEKIEKNIDHKKEIDELNADNEMSLEELIRKYKNNNKNTRVQKVDIDSDDDLTNEADTNYDKENDSDDTAESDDATEGSDEELTEDDESTDDTSSNSETEEDSKFGLKSLLADDNDMKSKSDNDDLINDAAALAESIQPKGNTLSSTNVVTPVPFLLRHSLREYQHIGLDWLVTMHERKLNGILADEMGLGKTIQTIALLAHLACVKGNWGPHLIIVPSSVMLNWEMEFKKWCPGFKILTYYGSQKERKQKRIGWTKANAFHVCITSYKLVIQDQQSFRRKKWKYLILDEAQNIKNFKSQRWQLLLNFQTEQRLLLTGTPLQNNLMELWSLMHFLMPHVFQSHREFKEWFSSPMTEMIEGNMEYNDSIIKRLHKVLRPFLLRRLKSEVEKQMPKKYEHVVLCRMSKRQRCLYDDFMSRSMTRETLATGNLLSVVNVLMQLRKVCNHPNLFEPRPTTSPFQMNGIGFRTSSLVCNVLDYDPLKHFDLNSLSLVLIQLEFCLTAYVAYKIRKHCPPKKLIEEIDSLPPSPPKCPRGNFKFIVRYKDERVRDNIISYTNGVKFGTSPAMKTEEDKLVPVKEIKKRSFDQVNYKRDIGIPILVATPTTVVSSSTIHSTAVVTTASNSRVTTLPVTNLKNNSQMTSTLLAAATGGGMQSIPTNLTYRRSTDLSTLQLQQQYRGNATISTAASMLDMAAVSSSSVGATQSNSITIQTSGRHFVLTPATSGTVITPSGQRITVLAKTGPALQQHQQLSSTHHQRLTTATATSLTLGRGFKQSASPIINKSMYSSNIVNSTGNLSSSSQLIMALAQQLKCNLSSAANNSSSIISISNVKNQQHTEEDELAEIEQKRKEERQNILQLMAKINQRRCDATPIYGDDFRESMKQFLKRNHNVEYTTWQSRSYTNCSYAMHTKDNWRLYNLIKSYENRTQELLPIFENFVFCVPAVSAPTPYFEVYHHNPSKLNEIRRIEIGIREELTPKLRLLHPIASAMCTQFPDPRLIQYDCGKLQTLDSLLKKLKRDGHRVLIFTQMTKMLDVLEAFLNYHGHIYLRLDGTTRVEQRQLLMERFNGDKRIFAFILSTRSGGIGVNLTGADTVIFYDSDWNPTMDAQAQDRCHRIGQTRDVHIYRLVSEKTVEENILRKANQKRLLGDLAIEGGNFTAAYFKSSTIHDLFQVDAGDDASARLCDVLNRDRERKQRLQHSLQQVPLVTAISEERNALGAFESALAAAEDEQDVQAAEAATAEAADELAEFDENIPIEETEKPEMSKAEQELANILEQLSPVEKYAVRFVEETNIAWTSEQLRAAELEIEQQQREWEANHTVVLQKEEEIIKIEEQQNDSMLTYDREDAKKQIWISDKTGEKMPIWCPPTPPQSGDDNMYVNFSMGFLYDNDIMSESELPPVYVKKENKRTRTEAGFPADGNRRPPKIRKEDNYNAPRSLFDRPSPAIAKIRRDLKMQRYRGAFKPNVQIPGMKLQIPQKPLVEPEGMPEWSICEDIAIVHILQNLQSIPLNGMLLSPGHTPNWDFVAETVNLFSKTYRSPKQCRWRYEAVIVPREEGKLLESSKKQKKLKTSVKGSPVKGGVKSLRISQMFISDNNHSFTKQMKMRFETIKSAYLKKAPPPKQIFGTQNQKNPKHIAVLNEFGIKNYDNPLTPTDIAQRKAEKLKEKQRNSMTLPPPLPNQQPGPPDVNQQQQAPPPQQQIPIQQQQTQTTAIIIQQPPQISSAVQQQQHQQQHQSHQHQSQQQQQQQGIHIMSRTTQQGNLTLHQHTAQIVKAIVTPASNIVAASQVQHISQTSSPQTQMQQQTAMQSSANIVTPSSVSVMLTTPVSTLSTVQHQHQQQQQAQTTQIVSLQQQSNVSAAPAATQPQSTTIVQTIPSQSLPQIVTVSQLATVGTVLTTSATLQPNATMASLNAPTLRAQRIVAAPGTLQEVVLQQRSNSQSPTIVSMSGLAQGVSQPHFQPAQLRLSMGNAQQVSGVVTKGIPVSSLQQAGKLTSQPQIQLYRQQAIRQQLKVLQTSTAQGGGTAAVVQTASGQTALVNTGTIIQGGIVPAGQTVQVQGQKVSVATVTAAAGGNVVAATAGNVGTSAGNVASVTTGNAGTSGVVTSVATVQVNPAQGRTQFIKQVGVGTKQTIARQVSDNELFLVKGQFIGQQKTQVIPQTQIFTPANVQVQQAGPSGQQQIATLVKTSSGAVATGGTVGMALSQLKPTGQIKVTMANQNQVRQLQLQQQIAIAQQRKVGKMAQIAQVAGKTNVPTQLIVQNPKNLPGSVTVQQIQQVIRHAQPGTLAAGGQIVLGKTSVGRVIPVSVASQPNARQTIQVVSAASAQALTAGNLRAHVANAQNIAGTIKVATGSAQVQTQQALLTALQNQQQQRQNASPVRLQTTSGGSLIAVAVQQQQQQQQQQQSQTQVVQQQQQNVSASTSTSSTADVVSLTQQTTQQQVRTLVKKKIMSNRNETE